MRQPHIPAALMMENGTPVSYSAGDLSKLQAHYTELRDKESYDAFVLHGHELLKRIGADPYHVRMALTRGYSMMEFGSRAAYQHRETLGGIEVGLLVNEADISKVPVWFNPEAEHFDMRGEAAFVKFTVPEWSAIPEDLLDRNLAELRVEHDRVMNTRLAEIRKKSLTTNESLKYAVLNGVVVDDLRSNEAIRLIMVNLTWNSNDWKSPSKDESNHAWVKAGNTPHESWNFDFDNPRNSITHVHGFWQCTSAPKVSGTNNLVIFHSDGRIVGFYGKARILREKEKVSEGQEINLIGAKSLSLVLPNKLDDIKAKGYLEDKQRIGQVGFIYLDHVESALEMIDEARDLNPDQSEKLSALRAWVAGSTNGTNVKKEHMSIPLNRILYGPPGTGKTFSTIGKAVEVCDPAFHASNKDNPEALRRRFNELKVKDWDSAEWQIAFCTFHQSFSYEDFVEGIKPISPKKDDTFLKYETRPGILKLIAKRANYHATGEADVMSTKLSFTDQEFDKAEFYKLSLGDTTNPDDKEIYDYCIQNNVIAIGFLDQHDLKGKSEEEIKALPLRPEQTSYAPAAMNYFCHYLRKGDYVVVTNGNYSARAIGRVTGDYRYEPQTMMRYPHLRSVEWLVKNEDVPYQELYSRQFSQQTIYKLKKEDIKRNFFVKGAVPGKKAGEAKRFVLIVDEINRGNVAGIFGELITLVEENKRAGRPEALEVTLPYSQERFSIPDNLYIIGTMNTADRSVEALDAALRRRFSFVHMTPEPGKLSPLKNSKIDLSRLLTTINARLVQLLDEDHQIGHSHFWELHKSGTPVEALQEVFADKVIPQLEEYFHRDRARLRMVLGDAFVEQVPADDKMFSDLGDTDFEARETYRLRPKSDWNEAAFIAIHG